MKFFIQTLGKVILAVIIIGIKIIPLYSQDLSEDETLSYIEKMLLAEIKEQITIPKTMGATNVKKFVVTLDYEYLILKTVLLDNEYHIKKAKLYNTEITLKYSSEKYWKSADVYKPGLYIVYINGDNLPPFAFLRKEDAQRIIKALTHLKSFCKPDPFR